MRPQKYWSCGRSPAYTVSELEDMKDEIVVAGVDQMRAKGKEPLLFDSSTQAQKSGSIRRHVHLD